MTKPLHLVRAGALGQIGGYLAAEAVAYPRASRVVLRTGRGLELGEVLCPPDGESLESQMSDVEACGTILRRVSIEDELLEARLLKNRQSALEACTRCIDEKGLPITLMDVEPLFDGQTLMFYFLGDLTGEVEQLVASLAEEYEAKAQLRSFAEALAHGCGPTCGTEAGGGCGSCTVGCAVAGACNTHRAKT